MWSPEIVLCQSNWFGGRHQVTAVVIVHGVENLAFVHRRTGRIGCGSGQLLVRTATLTPAGKKPPLVILPGLE